MKRLLLLVALTAVACSDNAIRLRESIDAAARSGSTSAGQELDVRYVPRSSSKPYWLLFFPDRQVQASELTERDVPANVAARIFQELAYVNVGTRPMLVVAAEGERLTFTSYADHDDVKIADLIVEQRTGPATIRLERRSDALWITGVR